MVQSGTLLSNRVSTSSCSNICEIIRQHRFYIYNEDSSHVIVWM
ncbi:rCG62886, isoform CRA_b [Rattus norvegicus]|uniref:RCG62886, isoform CRA_b n=1 Tax=Rattus norvegicus TaxID=10116 RepID=A6K5J8_RAT|nr:rCG62886, isoform CRA_b [Rattus norvegicus]